MKKDILTKRVAKYASPTQKENKHHGSDACFLKELLDSVCNYARFAVFFAAFFATFLVAFFATFLAAFFFAAIKIFLLYK
jgi:hypothetical protein